MSRWSLEPGPGEGVCEFIGISGSAWRWGHRRDRIMQARSAVVIMGGCRFSGS